MKNDFLEAYSIGLKLRTLRSQKQLTLSRLASQSGLSAALLSKLETNRMVPTLPTLAKICRIYRVGLGYFFSDVEDYLLTITRKAHISHSGRSQKTVTTIPLHTPQRSSTTITAIMEWPSGALSTIGELGGAVEITVMASGTRHFFWQQFGEEI